MDAAEETLTRSQAARRDRVIRAAIELGSSGGYDAVQMREVAATADVALGTIYRYFSSKDHLLAAAQVEWVNDLERRVSARPPTGDSTAARVVSVLRRATRAMEKEPQLSEALVTAISSPDKGAAECQKDVSASMTRIIGLAIGDDVDPAFKAQITRTLGHVWFSSLIGWVNGWSGIGQVGDEVEIAAHLVLDNLGA
jgi:AcrR family transcriptional regulator